MKDKNIQKQVEKKSERGKRETGRQTDRDRERQIQRQRDRAVRKVNRNPRVWCSRSKGKSASQKEGT